MKTIDEYIADQLPEFQERLNRIRDIIKKAAPDADERISWGMPTFHLNKNLVHFAQAKNHIGFYPGPSAIEKFSEEISGYKHSKGAIQFPLNEPLPEKLITEIVLFRSEENRKLK